MRWVGVCRLDLTYLGAEIAVDLSCQRLDRAAKVCQYTVHDEILGMCISTLQEDMHCRTSPRLEGS
jgi:hypothetical protein